MELITLHTTTLTQATALSTATIVGDATMPPHSPLQYSVRARRLNVETCLFFRFVAPLAPLTIVAKSVVCVYMCSAQALEPITRRLVASSGAFLHFVPRNLFPKNREPRC